MHKLIEKPLYIFISYIIVIAIFALLYTFSPTEYFCKDLNILEGFYLSAITITTLGYGDITPHDSFGMVATSIESIVGILIIGLFINSSWKRFSERLEEQQSEQIAISLNESNKNNLLSYYSYLRSVIGEYRIATLELTTPIGERNNKKDFSYGFKFSDLQDILNPSLLLRYSFDNPIIKIYYDTEESLIQELKFILANYSLEQFKQIKEHILAFLSFTHATNVKNALLAYTKFPKDNATRKTLTDLIKKFDDLPPKKYHRSNVLTPVIILFQSISTKMEYLDKLLEDFKELSERT